LLAVSIRVVSVLRPGNPTLETNVIEPSEMQKSRSLYGVSGVLGVKGIFSSLCFVALTIVLNVFSTTNVLAWLAMDANDGEILEIFSPGSADELSSGEIQFSSNDPDSSCSFCLGEVTSWIPRCYGRFCPSKSTPTFELNSFSYKGLMYLFPIN